VYRNVRRNDPSARYPRGGTRRHDANPRRVGTNPRTLGTNPRMGTAAELARVRRLTDRAYRLMHGAGEWLCHDCDDAHWLCNTPCHCRTLAPHEAARVVDILRPKHRTMVGSDLKLSALRTYLAELPD
jgi:hypothetical protein